MNKWYVLSVVFSVLVIVSFTLDFYVYYSDWYFYFYYNGIEDMAVYFLALICTFALLASLTFFKGYSDRKKNKN